MIPPSQSFSASTRLTLWERQFSFIGKNSCAMHDVQQQPWLLPSDARSTLPASKLGPSKLSPDIGPCASGWKVVDTMSASWELLFSLNCPLTLLRWGAASGFHSKLEDRVNEREMAPVRKITGLAEVVQRAGYVYKHLYIHTLTSPINIVLKKNQEKYICTVIRQHICKGNPGSGRRNALFNELIIYINLLLQNCTYAIL